MPPARLFCYAAFGFAAGVTIGMLMRRTAPAMAVTLIVVGGAVERWIASQNLQQKVIYLGPEKF